MFRLLLASAVICSAISLSGCDKEKDKKPITRSDLPMSGSQEVPVKTTPAGGSFDVSYDKKTHVLKFTLYWNALTGTPTGAHIHGPAPRGMNAGIKHDFFAPFPKTVAGSYSGATLVDGVSIIEDSLLQGRYYFNIHTALNPGGEIRGQIEF